MDTQREQGLGHRRDLFALLFMIAAFAVAVAVGILVFVSAYHSSIDGVLYRERLSQTKEVTSQLFEGLENVVEYLWNDAELHCSFFLQQDIATTEKLQEFMQEQRHLHGRLSDADIVAVDSRGCYMTQDGWQGALTEMDRLADRPEQVSFVSKTMTADQTYMYFLRRLDRPVVLADGDKTVTVCYYGISRSMTALDPYFSCKAYDNSNSVYVLDRYGSRLFRSSGSGSLLRGFNAFGILAEMEYLNGTSFEEAEHELRESGMGCSNAVLDGEEYYCVLYQMKNADWVLLFMVPSSYVATDMVSLVEMTSGFIITLAIAMFAVGTVAIVCVWHYRQHRDVVAEHRDDPSDRSCDAETDTMGAKCATDTKDAQKGKIAKHDVSVPRRKVTESC